MNQFVEKFWKWDILLLMRLNTGCKMGCQQVCLYLVKNPRKKESVDSELARSRVSKFYWLVALGSRVWVLVSPFV